MTPLRRTCRIQYYRCIAEIARSRHLPARAFCRVAVKVERNRHCGGNELPLPWCGRPEAIPCPFQRRRNGRGDGTAALHDRRGVVVEELLQRDNDGADKRALGLWRWRGLRRKERNDRVPANVGDVEVQRIGQSARVIVVAAPCRTGADVQAREVRVVDGAWASELDERKLNALRRRALRDTLQRHLGEDRDGTAAAVCVVVVVQRRQHGRRSERRGAQLMHPHLERPYDAARPSERQRQQTAPYTTALSISVTVAVDGCCTQVR